MFLRFYPMTMSPKKWISLLQGTYWSETFGQCIHYRIFNSESRNRKDTSDGDEFFESNWCENGSVGGAYEKEEGKV